MEALLRAHFGTACVAVAATKRRIFVNAKPANVSDLWWYYTMAKLQLADVFDPQYHIFCRAGPAFDNTDASTRDRIPVATAVISVDGATRLADRPGQQSDFLVLTPPAYYALLRLVPRSGRTPRLFAVRPAERRIVIDGAPDETPQHQLLDVNALKFDDARICAVLVKNSAFIVVMVDPDAARRSRKLMHHVWQTFLPSTNEAAIEAARLICDHQYALTVWYVRTRFRRLPDPRQITFAAQRQQLEATESFRSHGKDRTGLFMNLPLAYATMGEKLYRAIILEELFHGQPVEGYANFVEMAEEQEVALTSFL